MQCGTYNNMAKEHGHVRHFQVAPATRADVIFLWFTLLYFTFYITFHVSPPHIALSFFFETTFRIVAEDRLLGGHDWARGKKRCVIETPVFIGSIEEI